jgi:hypothetical protein
MIMNADQPKKMLESYPVIVRGGLTATMRVFRIESGLVGYGIQLEQRKDGMYRSITTELHDNYIDALDEAKQIADREFSAQERLL